MKKEKIVKDFIGTKDFPVLGKDFKASKEVTEVSFIGLDKLSIYSGLEYKFRAMEIFLKDREKVGGEEKKRFILHQYLLKSDYYVYYSEFDEPGEEKEYF